MTHPYTSFWHQTAEYKNGFNDKSIDKSVDLSIHKEFDILIVGAGLSGINTAFLLMNKGYKVAIIEASDLGYGASGYTTAKITFQHNLIYDYLIKNYGLDAAKHYLAANKDGMSMYQDIIKEYKIECDFEKDEAILYTTDKNKVYDLKNELDAYKKLNIDAELKESFNTAFPIVSGLVIKNQHKFNPLKYLYKTAEIVSKSGTAIYKNTRAIDIIPNSGRYKVITDKGNIFADKVVVTSHYPFDRNLKAFFLKIVAEKSYIIACKTNVKKFEGMYLSIDKNVRSIRYQKYKNEDILLVGGCNHKVGAVKDESLCYKELEEFLIKYFSKFEIISKWSTQDCMTHDKIPYIGNADKNIFTATGFNKWGMTTSAASAIIIKNIITGSDENYGDIFSPSRHFSINSSTVKEIGETGKNVTIGLVKRFLYYSKKDLETLEVCKGAVISHGFTKLGVYLDENGIFHCIEPICTHLGCEVKFNEVEKTWDCRCHGSRFDIKGDIIEGPAVTALKYYSIKKEDLINE